MKIKNLVLWIMSALGMILLSCVKPAEVRVASVKLDKSEAALTVGEHIELKTVVLPDDATDKTVAWSSSDEKIAVVDQNGKVTATSAGKATIIATAKDGSLVKGECKVTVAEKKPETVKVSKITLGKTTLQLKVGAEEKLTAEVLPDNASDKTVRWASSAQQCAAVDQTGLITAVSVGEATIIATAKDGSGVEGECTVTIITAEIPVESVTVEPNEAKLVIGQTFTPKAIVKPKEATKPTVTWTSGNETVATVDHTTGMVTAIAAGGAMITATTDGGKMAECSVTVDARSMTMTREGDRAMIKLAGAGEAVIDWGDGSDHETVELAPLEAPASYQHAYSNQTACDIVIRGDVALLDLIGNKATRLDVSKNNVLASLTCNYNSLTSLDISGNAALTYLLCDNNQIASLNVSNNAALTNLQCNSNKLTELNFSKSTELQHLGCRGNGIAKLDVSNTTALITMICDDNKLTACEVGNLTALEILSCGGNQLTDINVSGNTALKQFGCTSNKLTALDVSANTALTSLNFAVNEIKTIDLGKNTVLESLYCDKNKLESLDTSNNIALNSLYCAENAITKLDMTNNTKASYVDCKKNKFTAEELNALFGTLHGNAGYKAIYVANNPGSAACDKTIATSKKWKVF